MLRKADRFCGVRRNNTLPAAITHATVAFAVKNYCEIQNIEMEMDYYIAATPNFAGLDIKLFHLK